MVAPPGYLFSGVPHTLLRLPVQVRIPVEYLQHHNRQVSIALNGTQSGNMDENAELVTHVCCRLRPGTCGAWTSTHMTRT